MKRRVGAVVAGVVMVGAMTGAPVVRRTFAGGGAEAGLGGERGAEARAGQVRELGGGAGIALAREWVEMRGIETPPTAVLATSAPRITFVEILTAQNTGKQAIASLAVSDNPFEGSDAFSLGKRIQGDAGSGAWLQDVLFYFFFSPSKATLAEGKSQFERAKAKADAAAAGLPENERTARVPDAQVSVQHIVAPTLNNLFVEMLSSDIVFARRNNRERVTARYQDFYLPPMEQIERDGVTWIIFEAQGQRTLDLATVKRYGLPDAMQGARAFYFWAVGAQTPFPFVKDPQRGPAPITHVAYAALSMTGEARSEFQHVLRGVTVARDRK